MSIVSPKSLMLPYQLAWVNDQSRFKIGAMSRQIGKSFSTAEEYVEDSLRIPGTTSVCLSAGERQALEWLNKAKEWAEAYRFAIEDYAEEKAFAGALLNSAEIRFHNGSRIIAIPANPKTARGYSANVCLDEFAYHESPDQIWAAMFPALTNPLAGTFAARARALMNGKKFTDTRKFKLRVVSTFNGKGNKFYDLWENYQKNGFSRHLITIHDAIAQGLPLNVKELRAGLDDDDIWAQEYECIPMDSSTVLLPYELIQLAESVEATEANSVVDSASIDLYAGVDFGRVSDPTVLWLLERKNGLLITREVLVLKGIDTPSQQEILRSRLRMCKRVSFDYTGPGIGLGDYLARDYGLWNPDGGDFGKMDLCTFTAKFKRELFPKLRKAFEAPCQLRIPISQAIRDDLHAMQAIVKNGEYNYWAPRGQDGHSDRCTALGLAIRAADDAMSGPIFVSPDDIEEAA